MFSRRTNNFTMQERSFKSNVKKNFFFGAVFLLFVAPSPESQMGARPSGLIRMGALGFDTSAAFTYSVTYNGNGNTGGTTPTDANTYGQGTPATTLGNTGSLIKIGYTFSIWNTQTDGNGIDRAPGTTWSMGTSNVTLFAKYTVNSYSLIYNANGGTGTGTDPLSPYNYNTPITVKANSFTYSDHTFSSWNTAADGSGTSFSPGNTFSMPGKTVTLYAQWFVPQSVNLIGKITNQAGNPVANAIVTLVKQAMKDTTGSDGVYTLINPVSVLQHTVPNFSSISVSKGFIDFKLSNLAPVKIEIFDVKGTLLKKELLQNPPKGFYRFNIEGNFPTANLLIIRASIGQDRVLFRYLPLSNGKYVVNQFNENTKPVKQSRVKKIAIIDDTLKITATGYITSVKVINSYSQRVDITLDTISGSGSDISFRMYNPWDIMASHSVYSTNGTLISSTYFSYVENTGSAGIAAVTINYQGYTETQQFPVEAQTKYVLGSKLTMTNAGQNLVTYPCQLSSQLPGLTLSRNMASKPTMNDPGGKCPRISGPTTSFLIPLSACSCSEWFAIDGNVRFTNCGLRDPNCCNTCPSGKTCNNGSCK